MDRILVVKHFSMPVISPGLQATGKGSTRFGPASAMATFSVAPRNGQKREHWQKREFSSGHRQLEIQDDLDFLGVSNRKQRFGTWNESQ